MVIVFITCKNQKEAQKIGLALLKKRLAACIGLIPKASSIYFWPPRKSRIQKSKEVILLVDTVGKKFWQIEKEVKRLHSYQTPCIIEIPISRVHKPYLKWLEQEINL